MTRSDTGPHCQLWLPPRPAHLPPPPPGRPRAGRRWPVSPSLRRATQAPPDQTDHLED
jgi:hypothetical protein